MGAVIPMRVVYCLTSSGGDIYEAMTRVSLATVRRSNPSANVLIACDKQTYTSLGETDSRLLREADEVIPFATPAGSAVFRNRHIKTRLRCLVENAFLFLDSDTAVRKDIRQIYEIVGSADIAAAPNHSSDLHAGQIWSEDRENLKRMNWQVDFPYFNGGVIFYSDTSGAYSFSEGWHKSWLQNIEATGRLRDQTALNYTLRLLHTNVAPLPHRFNGQFLNNPSHCWDATIWHYHSSWSDGKPATEFMDAVRLVQQNRQICDVSIERIMHAPHPWKSRTPIDDWIARRISKRNSMTPLEKLWFSGRYSEALVRKFKASVNRITI